MSGDRHELDRTIYPSRPARSFRDEAARVTPPCGCGLGLGAPARFSVSKECLECGAVLSEQDQRDRVDVCGECAGGEG